MRAEFVKEGLGMDIRRKFGRGGGFGRVAFGYNYFGFYSKYSGIYQKHYYYGEAYISKMKFYRPTNPQTVDQQNWRAVMADAVLAWQSLDLDAKKIFNKRAVQYKISGYNLFLRDYLNSHKL